MPIVLVAEDEALVRLDAAVTLEDEGFQVLEAATARAALAMLEKRNGEVAALFTDVDMPGDMNGLELAGIVHHRWPHIALVITSGVVRQPTVLPGRGIFLAKPYRTDATAKLIWDLITQTAAQPRHEAAQPRQGY
jgi:DNA-binding NtrC family response regulator